MTSADARSGRASAARSQAAAGGRIAAWWPRLVVAAAVTWNLVNLRALTLGVTYLNDATMHEQMVRFATARLRAGHLPLTSWFPFLGEGSPQFLHYQSLPAMLAGAVGLVTGPDVAFRWSLYLLLSLWPASVYLAARAFGGGRAAAAASAGMAPFLISVTGVGYEQAAYTWNGYGVWTQLWAMWTLPLAWGWSWRAVRDGRGYFRAVAVTALTVALHFETGYLALSVLFVWPFAAGRPLLPRLRRAAMVLGGSLLASAWVIVPLLAQRQWAGVNQVLQGTGLVNGYGARQVLRWLLTGQVLDSGRLPAITVLAALGFGLAWLAWSSNAHARALLIALAVCLLLTFGRTTFGSLVNVIPGSTDLFFRRFMMGVQFAALLLAGQGAAWLAAGSVRLIGNRMPRRTAAPPPPVLMPVLSAVVVLAAGVAVLAPAWTQLGAFDRQNSAAITAERRADSTQGADLDRLIAVIKRDGGGRTYAGLPMNWGADFTVGAVPVFKYLESKDVDEVGYTLRTASLMTGPEYYFEEGVPSDYRLFGIRYLILPSGGTPPVPARLETRSGFYSLWTVSTGGYIQVGQVTGELPANRTNIGTQSISLLGSGLASDDAYFGVSYGSGGNAGPLPPRRSRAKSPAPQFHAGPGTERGQSPAGKAGVGSVSRERADLNDGEASATVQMRRPGIAVLSASYDPGWTATVNGRPAPVWMVAPALAAVDVPAGTDHVVFRYQGYGGYPALLALGGLALIAAAAAPAGAAYVRRRRKAVRHCARRSSRPRAKDEESPAQSQGYARCRPRQISGI